MRRRIAECLPEIAVRGPSPLAAGKPLGTGLVIGSRLPMRRTTYRALPGTGRPKEALASKGLFVAELAFEDTVLKVGNVHLGIGSAASQRQHHDALLHHLDDMGPLHLLCGDFNQAAAGAPQRYPAYETHEPYLREALRERGYVDVLESLHGEAAGEMVTVDSDRNPLLSPGYHLRIDYIWARGDEKLQIRPTSAGLWLDQPLAGQFVSDHFGVQATVEIQRVGVAPTSRQASRTG